MSHLRAASRAIILCAIIGAMFVLLFAGLVAGLFSERVRTAWRSFIFRNSARATAGLLNISITRIGAPPHAPFFLVANHLSYTDIIVLASQVDCSFIAKREVSKWPVIGLLCRGVGTIFIDRANRRDIARVNEEVERALAEGRGVVLFAEGTSSQGASVLSFKPGLLDLAARAGFAVSYAALSYSVPERERPAHLSVCWWGEMTFFKHLWGLLQVSEITATLIFGRRTFREGDRKTLARQLHAAVQQEFIPVVQPEEEWSAVLQ